MSLRNATWPVLVVAGVSLAGGAMLSQTQADDLDPAVWQAITEAAVPKILEPVKTGEN